MTTADQYEARTASWHIHEAAVIEARLENNEVHFTSMSHAHEAIANHLAWAQLKVAIEIGNRSTR